MPFTFHEVNSTTQLDTKAGEIVSVIVVSSDDNGDGIVFFDSPNAAGAVQANRMFGVRNSSIRDGGGIRGHYKYGALRAVVTGNTVWLIELWNSP